MTGHEIDPETGEIKIRRLSPAQAQLKMAATALKLQERIKELEKEIEESRKWATEITMQDGTQTTRLIVDGIIQMEWREATPRKHDAMVAALESALAALGDNAHSQSMGGNGITQEYFQGTQRLIMDALKGIDREGERMYRYRQALKEADRALLLISPRSKDEAAISRKAREAISELLDGKE